MRDFLMPVVCVVLSGDVVAGFNQSDNVTNWLVRYCVANPDNPAPRNYAAP
jgi:hypothetical protein